MTQALDPHLSPLPAARPSSVLTWSARLLSWFCWLAMAGVSIAAVMGALGLLPDKGEPDRPSDTLIRTATRLLDPAAQQGPWPGCTETGCSDSFPCPCSCPDAAPGEFMGLSRGEYFGRSTVTGLRNLGLAVLLYNTVSPVVVTVPRVIFLKHAMAGQHGELNVELAASLSRSP